MAGSQIEVSDKFHSLNPDNIDSYYAMNIVEKFQEMGKFFDECIDCIEGPCGLLKKSIQIKLGDKLAGNDDKIDLQAMLVLLREIHKYSYQGIKYVSQLGALKHGIDRIKHEKIWKTELKKFEFGNLELSSVLKNAMSEYGCMYACGSIAGGSVGLLSVGAGLGVIFGATLLSLTNIFSIFGAVIGVTALGICAGLFGFWLYKAVKLGNNRSSTFEKFRELYMKLDETNFRSNLKNFVLTLKNYCEGVRDIVVGISSRVRSKSTTSMLMISHVKPNEQDLLRKFLNYYQKKVDEFARNMPDMSEENQRLIALNVVMDQCKEKLGDLEYSDEEIDQFITQRLMPEIKDLENVSI